MSARQHVMQWLEQAEQPLSTEEIAHALRQAHDEQAVVDALDELRRESEVIQDADGNWSLREPR